MSASAILKQFQTKELEQIEDLPEQTLKKMQDGAKKSIFLSIKLKKYFNQF